MNLQLEQLKRSHQFVQLEALVEQVAAAMAGKIFFEWSFPTKACWCKMNSGCMDVHHILYMYTYLFGWTVTCGIFGDCNSYQEYQSFRIPSTSVIVLPKGQVCQYFGLWPKIAASRRSDGGANDIHATGRDLHCNQCWWDRTSEGRCFGR